jgi:hypothetical protein
MRTALEHYGTKTGGIGKGTIREMKLWLDDLPDPSPDIREDRLWSCHVISRAIKYKWRLQGWTVVDGTFHTSQHSWLEYTDVILDTYPVASLGGPLLVDKSFWRSFYRPLQGYDFPVEQYEQQVQRLLSLAYVHDYRRSDCKLGACSPNNCRYPDCILLNSLPI